MKQIRFLLVFTAFVLALTLIGACRKTEKTGQIKAALSLADASDYYIGTMVGAAVRKAFEEAGAAVQVFDAGNDVTNQMNQIQNAITSGNTILYVFPAGDGTTYFDVLQTARQAGVKTLTSNTYPGDGGADVYVGSDEFQMGVMMSALLSEWVDKTYPAAGQDEVTVLIVEATINESAIKRCLGMRLAGEKFLRKCDTAAVYYIKKEGPAVAYLDSNGTEIPVNEPSGGLLLDKNGRAILNPYYNPKIKLIEYSNRNSAGFDSTEAQKAVENALTMGYNNLAAVISYGDTGAAVETKVRELRDEGRIATDLNKLAVFCSDLTNTNRDLILRSYTDASILRGVMGAGDLIGTLQNYAKKMVAGEHLPAYTMEPISYMTVAEDGNSIRTVYYTDCPQLPATEKFFAR
ncbi:MAG: substrate-binding domain-containing protein [Spirochaetaceae bacterium]|jgi:ABC-type sugar transport system substrate-binding protein|nr:substrate-binding domain-containing protein [Spirochaetaceae bacterium]